MIHLKNQRGITLAEILIAMAFIGVLATLAYSLQFFGLKSFMEGGNQANIQQNVRLASELLRKDLRNTSNVRMVEVNQALPEGYEGYYLENGTFTKTDASFSTDEIFEEIEVSFEEMNEKVIVKYEIIGLNQYRLKDQIILNNVVLKDLQDQIAIGEVYSLIEYRLIFKK